MGMKFAGERNDKVCTQLLENGNVFGRNAGHLMLLRGIRAGTGTGIIIQSRAASILVQGTLPLPPAHPLTFSLFSYSSILTHLTHTWCPPTNAHSEARGLQGRPPFITFLGQSRQVIGGSVARGCTGQGEGLVVLGRGLERLGVIPTLLRDGMSSMCRLAVGLGLGSFFSLALWQATFGGFLRSVGHQAIMRRLLLQKWDAVTNKGQGAGGDWLISGRAPDSVGSARVAPMFPIHSPRVTGRQSQHRPVGPWQRP